MYVKYSMTDLAKKIYFFKYNFILRKKNTIFTICIISNIFMGGRGRERERDRKITNVNNYSIGNLTLETPREFTFIAVYSIIAHFLKS